MRKKYTEMAPGFSLTSLFCRNVIGSKRGLSPLPRKPESHSQKVQRSGGTAMNATNPAPAVTKRAASATTQRTRPLLHSSSRSRGSRKSLTNVANDIAASNSYQHNWTQVILGSTSGLVFAISITLIYYMYILCRPYGDSISFGMLLSVILHSKTRKCFSDSRAARQECAEQMQAIQKSWAERSKLFSVVGSLLSLEPFFRYALLEAARFLGLHKLLVRSWWVARSNKGTEKHHGKGEKVFLISTPRGPMLLRLIAMCALSYVAHSLVGFSFFLLMHLVFLVMFAVTVPFVSEEYFVELMWRLWRIAVVTFFVIGLTYNLALDVLSVSGAVKRTTSAVVGVPQEWAKGGGLWANSTTEGESVAEYVKNNPSNSTGANSSKSTSYLSEIQEVIVTELQHRVLKELSECINETNATELAMNVRHALSPMIATFPPKITIASMLNKSRELYTSLFNSNNSSSIGTSLRKVDWVGVTTSLLERWLPFFVYATRVVFLLCSNVVGFFDSVYAFVLFLFVLQYSLQMEHTIVYYVVAKMFKAIHPEFGERHARNIERDITVSLLTLLQSFWHLSWFHFCITFCLFQRWSFPTPFFCGLLSALTAVFPLLPTWFSPVTFALVYSVLGTVSNQGVLGVAVDLRVWYCVVAFILSRMDEWLLSVSRGLRGSSVRDADGVVREELPTFVVGTALLLGYVSYGVRGILLGPITVIMAKVFFDNWDLVVVREKFLALPSEQESEQEAKKK